MWKKFKEWFFTINLTMLLVLNLFLILMAVLAVTTLCGWLAVRLGWAQVKELLHPAAVTVLLYSVSVLLAVSVVVMIRLVILKPVRGMVGAMQRLAGGDFSVRMTCDGWMRPLELREFTAAFNKAAEELGGTEILRKDFINNFSHEFKTPIVSIRGFARRLRRCGLSPAQQNEYLDFIAAESLRLSRLASGILLLSKYEAQNLVADQAPCYLDEQLRASVLRQESRWAPRGLTFEMDLPRLRCRANAEMLGHVWDNLIGNAVKFSHDGGCIHISGRTEGEKENAFVTVTIRDEGVGIPQQALGHIFDKFYQAAPARAAEGSGLGLPLVRRILDLCGGRITAQSAPGRGSTFTVTLPHGGANGTAL